MGGWQAEEKIRKAYPERNEMINEIRLAFHIEMAEKNGGEAEYKPLRDEYDEAFTKAVHKDVRDGIVNENVRPSGASWTIRPLSSEVGFCHALTAHHSLLAA